MYICSVIICTYNRGHLVKRALLSLARQTLKPEQFEVIVVDDGSQDDTPKICERLSSELSNLSYVSTGNNIGLAGARNVGIKEASGKYILFTDDDCIPTKNWVERLSAALDREPIVAGAVASPVSNYIKLCHNIAQFHAFMPGRKAGLVEFIAGANMGFQRSVLEELNGFQTDLKTSQDMEFILRAREKGYRVYFVPDAVVTHDHDRTTLATVFRYSSEHAVATILLRNQYQSLLHTPFVLRSPAMILAVSPLIALKVTAGIYTQNPSLAKLFWTAPVVYALKLAWCWGAAQGLRKPGNAKGET